MPGVSLARLVRFARLTPRQALVIAAEVLGHVSRRHAEGAPVGGVDVDRVWVGLDGRVGLVDAAARAAPPLDPGAVDTDVASCRRLLADLVRVARGGAECERAAARLLMSAPDLDGGMAASAATLRAATSPGGPQVTTELAALVAALAPTEPAARPGTSPAPRPADGPTTEEPAGPPRGAVVELVRVAVARWGRWCLAVLVVLGLLGLELVVFGERIGSDVASLRAAGSAADGHSAAASAAPAPVPAPAPVASGPITSVDLRALARCEPGRECATRVQVRLRPGTPAGTVSWAFRLTDRCTGATWSVPGGSMRTGAGGDQIAVVAGLPLPPGRALGVTAVTSVPARAASPTLLVPAEATCAGPAGPTAPRNDG